MKQKLLFRIFPSPPLGTNYIYEKKKKKKKIRKKKKELDSFFILTGSRRFYRSNILLEIIIK
jgi:hypothetical protein